MENKNILVYDSGIGGLSVLAGLDKVLRDANLTYYGDNDNAPYGSKNELRLFDIVFNNIINVPFRLDLIVLACNTASLSIRDKIEYCTGIKTFGVFPSIESEIINNKKTLLLGTPLTVSKIKNHDNLTKIGLKNLAIDIERKIFNLSALDIFSHFNHEGNFSIKELKNNKFDSVILGCTHYHFIKNQIYDHFRPLKIVSGNTCTIKKVYEFCQNGKSLDKYKQNTVLFYGKNAQFNKEIYDLYYNKL